MDKPHHPIVIQPWKLGRPSEPNETYRSKREKSMGGSFRRCPRSLLRRKTASRVPRRSLRLDCSTTFQERVDLITTLSFLGLGRRS